MKASNLKPGDTIQRKSGNEPMFVFVSFTRRDKKNMPYGYVECPYCHGISEKRLDVCELPYRSCGCIRGQNISKAKRHEDILHQDFNGKRFYKAASGYWKSADGIWMHRYVWEVCNGVNLQEGYEVHHIDRNRDNNAPDNLIAMPKDEHRRLHAGLVGTGIPR